MYDSCAKNLEEEGEEEEEEIRNQKQSLKS